MPGIESYGRGSAGRENSREVQNAEQMPVIECGVAAIRVGLFVTLKRRFQRKYGQQRAVPMAYCVTYNALGGEVDQPTLSAFARENKDVIENETASVLSDEQLADNVLLAYAALMMLYGWRTGDPFNAFANQLIKRASDSSAMIPNIVQMWGSEAITRFFATAQDFMTRSVSGSLQ